MPHLRAIRKKSWSVKRLLAKKSTFKQSCLFLFTFINSSIPSCHQIFVTCLKPSLLLWPPGLPFLTFVWCHIYKIVMISSPSQLSVWLRKCLAHNDLNWANAWILACRPLYKAELGMSETLLQADFPGNSGRSGLGAVLRLLASRAPGLHMKAAEGTQSVSRSQPRPWLLTQIHDYSFQIKSFGPPFSSSGLLGVAMILQMRNPDVN